MKLIFATNNQHKIEEVRAALPDNFYITTLQEAGIMIDIPEPHSTLKENAKEKATTIYKLTGTDCFSEDTGLEVFSLNNEPGVHSARYAGEEKSFEKNIDKLLMNLENKENREAQFKTVVCLIVNKKEYYFEGICEGKIIKQKKGIKGFGYDPVFVPDGADKTFAEMSIDEKTAFSHRKKALDKLVTFLNNLKIYNNQY
ncbi:MAG TPA: RdgB/HAM1 family non-canonical purine NTP pyrophosphatase [Flavisolibacter sp.]|nr:RdgB/HAM1 family non-canonical purine NTP pyrophosphatase [Flavisolibacter sp.]